MAQVPGMQTQNLTNIITGANESRYGGDGVNGVMAWIQEQNPNLDQSTYIQLQREIAAGRQAFQDSQSLVLDRVRAYKTDLGTFWRGKMMRLAGFPRIDFDKYTIVSTSDTRGAFDTKTDAAPIQLR